MKTKRDLGNRSDSQTSSTRKGRRVHWIWPVGLAVAGLGSAAAYMLRGCWHRHMGWPTHVEGEDFSYQVCVDCGIKRLFDDRNFVPFGPYGYHLDELIAREHLARRKRIERAELASKRAEARRAAIEENTASGAEGGKASTG